ncbi:uncharacterized protein LOC110986807 [Acanthaster planci]|uniref:Uncharacterized protein LOC110986807 n=1 Tax=Acanthaster planci TaxID=133434 RepID=A0A8B7ZIK7_ACAPL|nr:uncharacterized protein LOC110986807 [Acanthaster planci]
MNPETDVPFMRISATVRRSSPQESYSPPGSSSGSSFADLLSGGPFADEPWCSFELGSHLSEDSSSTMDRKLAVLTENEVMRSSKRQSNQDSIRVQRMRSDLPEPRQLRTRPKRGNKTKGKRHGWDISEHIAQLKRKCSDFNWGKAAVEIRNRHKSEEVVATVRRCSLPPPSDTRTSWEPVCDAGARTRGHAVSGLCRGDAVHSEATDFWRWDGGAAISPLELGDQEIPSYLRPPSKSSYQWQSKISQVPETPPFLENPILYSHLDSEETVGLATSKSPTVSSHHNSRWDQFIMQQED